MRLDSLVRLIEGADFMAFREIALLYLKSAGYQGVELRDGPRDGGQDVALWQLGGNPAPIAVQLSVQRTGWERKLRQDAAKAKTNFGMTQFVYVTSRRIAPLDASTVTDKLWSQQSIGLRIVDSQAIASKMHLEGKASQVLESLGIRTEGIDQGRSGPGTSLRQELAYAYAFFGTDVETFRQTAIERSLIAFLTRGNERPTRAEATDSVAKALQLAKGQVRLVETQIDRMLQRGDIHVEGSRLEASARLADAHKAAHALRASQRKELETAVLAAVGDAGLRGKSLERATAAVMESAGALMLHAASAAEAAIAPGGDEGPARGRIRNQLRKLNRVFQDSGVEPGDTSQLVTSITEIISASDLGQNLLAGDLFLSLLQMESPALLSALGGREDLSVFLDASVAIPMLASLLYEPHDEHFFRAAFYAYSEARQHGVSLHLPRDYLEEAASHLLDAFDRYQPLLDEDTDLRFSQNAFVAHYSALKQEGKFASDFVTYARNFGLRPTPRGERHYMTERDWIMARMRTLFVRYGIAVSEPGQVPKQALRAAEQAIAYTARELGLERSGRLLEHDTRAVADISARAATGNVAVMFCTWDRLHLRLRTSGGSVDWNALNPAMLGDLLALISPDEDSAAGAAIDVALELGESEARRGSEIWDELVRIEKDQFYDADLMSRARSFVESYMARARQDEPQAPVRKAWMEWKGAAPEIN